MPILDVEMVVAEHEGLADGLASRLAAVAASALASAPPRTWVRLRTLPEAAYGEGDGGPPSDVRPVFVTVWMAAWPDDLAAVASRLTTAIAEAMARPASNVHVLFEPPARGRIAFGGQLVE